MPAQQAQRAQITVHPPLTQKKLSRYQRKKGTYLIRDHQGTVLYIGTSKDLYNTICRLFQNKGILQGYDMRRIHYEIVFTQLQTPCIKSILQRHFSPLYNRRIQPLERLNTHQQWRAQKILEEYLSQSRFTPVEEVEGEHRTDTCTPD